MAQWLEGFLGQPWGQGPPSPRFPGLRGLGRLPPPAPSPRQGPTLTGEDLEGERVLLLDGVGEMEAGVAAVVCLHVWQHHIGEVQVSVVSLGHTLVLGDGLHGCKEAEGPWETGRNDHRNDDQDARGDQAPAGGHVGPVHYLV